MKTQRLLLILTLVNLGLLSFHLAPVEANDGILRGSGIEIVDSTGKLRAQLVVAPGDATFKMPDGTTGYPETVIFRLITPDGKPRVKLTTSEEASGLMLLGSTDDTQSILKADGKESALNLRNSESVHKLVTP